MRRIIAELSLELEQAKVELGAADEWPGYPSGPAI